ncbi:MAG: hypothetical protein V3U71_01470 [Cocleimonas sp.]
MLQKPTVHLFIPHLFQPLVRWNKAFKFKPICQSFDDYSLRLSALKFEKVHDLEASFYNYLGVNEAELPIAQYRYELDEGIDKTVSVNKSLLCVDPIHLEIGLNDINLTEIIYNLSDSEVKSLKDLINKYFIEDGLTLISDSKNQCYVTFPKSESVTTTPVRDVLNKNVTAYLPVSNDRNWQVIQNEMQMLLHSSKINHRRELEGLPTINSLWLWGGGNKQKIDVNLSCIYSQAENIGQIFSKVASCKWLPLTAGLDQILHSGQSETVIILDQLILASQNDNIDEYQQQLTQIDKDYLVPLMRAWQQGIIDLTLHSCDGHTLQLENTPAWKFWRKQKTLLDLADETSST